LRHGESLWNIKNLCQGQKDIELSENGLKEAEAFALKFANFPIDYICTSPLSRALKTAEIIKKHHPKAGFSLVKEFSERNWGHLEGISSEAMYRIERLEEEDPYYKPDPSVETRQDLKARIDRGLKIAFDLHHKPLIVSHGRLFLSLCELLNIPINRQIKNLCLIEFSYQSDRWHAQEVILD
jgi:broad specificity phosphatase PhoE